MIKKYLVAILSILAIFGALFTYSPVYADSGSSFTGRTGSKCQGFLGLTSWDCNVDIKDEESLKGGVLVIAANVATDIIIIAAYLVIGYVIYGGYLYMFATDDPNKAATGKKAISQALIGLAIVLSAYIILNAIRAALIDDKMFADCAMQECINPGDMFVNALGWVIGIAGVVSAIFIIYGGIAYSTSAGEPTKLQKAKQVIVNALIGLAIVALAELITAFVSNMIRNADDQADLEAYINQTTISKELE